ncbi:MAG: mechanosensitive ion channel domain-containing protein [Pseudomonadota bacterium]
MKISLPGIILRKSRADDSFPNYLSEDEMERQLKRSFFGESKRWKRRDRPINSIYCPHPLLMVIAALFFILALFINTLKVYAVVSTAQINVNSSKASQKTESSVSEEDKVSSKIKEDKKPKWEQVVKNIWNFELIVIDNHPVTVKKVLSALIVLIIGVIFIKYVTRAIEKRFLPRTQLKSTTAVVLVKLFYYFALLLAVLFALHMLNLPLTAFAFLGGAIAIGLGFGAQNIINNFISGFIIMAERPIKIGDLVEVDGNFAIVEEIGARCTRIRTGANVHILVPNSSFLEKNIINWTLSDQRIRTSITVGVVYGSPVGEVRRLLIQAVVEHPKIIKEPEPFVLFKDFGDNALIFEVYFWVNITKLMERQLMESDVRFRIDELFREAGIVIAFPQRDIHLDTRGALEIRITDTHR